MSFDWKTEERDWDVKSARQAGPPPAAESPHTRPEPPVEEEAAPAGPRRTRRRTAAFVVVAAILLLATAGLVYRQLDRRIAEAEGRAETEVLASHEIVRNAAAEGDTELFVGFLSGRDAQWAAAQAGLVDKGAYDNRSSFGFYASAADSPNDRPAVTLASDLDSAELATLQSYDVAVGAGLTETVTLTQTAIYRRGPDRWLLAPPDPEFWGEEQMTAQRNFLLRYPARDESIARRLSRDLDVVLRELCGGGDLVGGDCPHLLITLSADPAALSADADLRQGLNGGVEIVLPTPTLFGLPVDEAGYRALQREYAARVVGAIAAHYTGWTCCTHSAFYNALLDAQLHELGLRPWPMTADPFARLAGNSFFNEWLEGLWYHDRRGLEPEEVRPIYALVEFLTSSTSPMPILDMQRLLLSESTVSLDSWLAKVTFDQYDSPAGFERALVGYAVSRAEMQPSAPLPQQDLQLICRTPGALRASLYRYDWPTATLNRERTLSILTSPMLAALPQREGVVIFGRQGREAGDPPYLWRAGRMTPITFGGEADGGYVALPPQAGTNAVTFFLDNGSPASPYALLSPERCGEEAPCPADTVIGKPLPSPGGERSLYGVGAPDPLMPAAYQQLIYLGDHEGGDLHIVGHGWSPFWLSDDSFGYVTTPEGVSGQAVVVRRLLPSGAGRVGAAVADVGQTSAAQDTPPRATGGTTGNETTPADDGDAPLSPPDILMTTADLMALDLFPVGTSVFIDRILPGPTGENLFIFTANPLQPDVPGQAMVYNLKMGDLARIFSIDGEPFDYRRAYGFSPDGRWLTVGALQAASQRETTWIVYVHAVDGSATYPYVLTTPGDWPADWLMDWSADGRWLALATSGYVRLIAPDNDDTLPLVFDDLDCAAAVWVNKE